MTIPFEILLTQWLEALENHDMSPQLNIERTADVGAFNWKCVVRFEVYSPRHFLTARGWFVRRPLEDILSEKCI
jgi:hypothetical protein